MRVLMVSKALVAGTYRQKLTELARLGVELTAVVPPEWREGGGVQRLEPAEQEEYELLVTPIRWNGHFHVHYYPELASLIRLRRPDLVHVDEEPYNLATYLGARAAGRAAARSVFFTYQNLLRRYPPPFVQMERAVYRVASHALAASEEAAAVLRAKGYAGGLSIVPQFGVDPDVFSPAAPPTGTFTIGFLNRLIPAKGPLLMLDALALLPDDTRLCMVGDGPLRPILEEQIEQRGLEGRVTMRPRVPSDHMPDLIRNLHVIALPSLTTATWKEQFGRILVEAMACQVPVVGSDSGEIPRVVGDAGLIVPEGDAAALARALHRLYDDASLRAELGCRGRRRVLEQFTHASVAERTRAAYHKAMSA